MPPLRSARHSSRRPRPSRRRHDSKDEAEGSGSDGDRRGASSRRAQQVQRRRGVNDDEARAADMRARRNERQQQPRSLAASQGEDDEDEFASAQEEDNNEDDDEEEDDDRVAPLQHQHWKATLSSRALMNVSERARNLASSMGKHEVKMRAQDLVRMALFAQLRNAPVRREDINKKVLNKPGTKDYSPALPVVFNRAQQTLRFTFGYEMVELRARGTDNEQITRAQTQDQSAVNGSGGGAETQGGRKSTTAKQWILRSVLPTKVIERMSMPQENLAECVNKANTISVNKGRDPSGVLLDWTSSGSELGTTGLLFLVLGLILINGRNLADGALRSYLSRMSLEPSRPLPAPLQPRRGSDVRHGGKLTVEEWLDELVRHAYLERIRSSVGAKASAATHQATLEGRRTQARGSSSRAKNRRSGGGEDENANNVEWRWGGRAEAEISEIAVAQFVAKIFLSDEQTRSNAAAALSRAAAASGSGGAGHRGRGRESGAAASQEDQQQDGEQLTEVERRKKREEQILREIERVVGSQLIK